MGGGRRATRRKSLFKKFRRASAETVGRSSMNAAGRFIWEGRGGGQWASPSNLVTKSLECKVVESGHSWSPATVQTQCEDALETEEEWVGKAP